MAMAICPASRTGTGLRARLEVVRAAARRGRDPMFIIPGMVAGGHARSVTTSMRRFRIRIIKFGGPGRLRGTILRVMVAQHPLGAGYRGRRSMPLNMDEQTALSQWLRVRGTAAGRETTTKWTTEEVIEQAASGSNIAGVRYSGGIQTRGPLQRSLRKGLASDAGV